MVKSPFKGPRLMGHPFLRHLKNCIHHPLKSIINTTTTTSSKAFLQGRGRIPIGACARFNKTTPSLESITNTFRTKKKKYHPYLSRMRRWGKKKMFLLSSFLSFSSASSSSSSTSPLFTFFPSSSSSSSFTCRMEETSSSGR